MKNLTGGTGKDRFFLDGGALTGEIDGGIGTDTLVGPNTAPPSGTFNDWQITGAN